MLLRGVLLVLVRLRRLHCLLTRLPLYVRPSLFPPPLCRRGARADLSLFRTQSKSALSASASIASSLSSEYSVLSKSALSASSTASKSVSSAMSSAGYDPSVVSKSASSAGSVAEKSGTSQHSLITSTLFTNFLFCI